MVRWRWLLVVVLLFGCGTPSPAARAWEDAARDDASTCEAPEDDQCVALACEGEEGVCGLFSCEDVASEPVARASQAQGADEVRSAAFRPPPRGPGPFRHWRRLGVREGARPRAQFHFEYRFGFLPAFPRYEGKVIKHHLFPQAQEFRRWFGRAGIDPHQYTLVIPEHIHFRIHAGDGRGGLWNAAWREYVLAHLEAPPPTEVIFRHAFKLAFRYKLVGPIVPYHHRVAPIGPQLYGD
jgi:uncharacterized lipoprotein (TIGR02269 family)